MQHPRLEFRCAQETVSYTLLPSCKMEVTFATEASTITSITLIGLYDKTVTITSQSQESLQKLYRCLTREISHKGFNEYFKPKKRLGRGNFATVYLVEHRATGQEMAAKVFSREGQNI